MDVVRRRCLLKLFHGVEWHESRGSVCVFRRKQMCVRNAERTGRLQRNFVPVFVTAAIRIEELYAQHK